MSTHTPAGIGTGRRLNSISAGLFGSVFVVVGLGGFTVSGGHSPAGHRGGDLFGLFQVNMLHNVVHLATGAVLVAAAITGIRSAKLSNAIIGGVYVALGALGLFIMGDNPINVVALNGADNGLHFIVGGAMLAVGLMSDRL
jgi:hypothetical protein